jgi:hypothetical protein
VPKVTSSHNYLLISVQTELELGGFISECIGNGRILQIQKKAILRIGVKARKEKIKLKFPLFWMQDNVKLF